MAKVIDITEKLSFSGNPKLIIKDKELEVNADAATVLQVMGIINDGTDTTPKDVVDMYNLIFPEKERKAIEEMKLGFNDFYKVVECAIDLISGGGEVKGEAQTHTTT